MKTIQYTSKKQSTVEGVTMTLSPNYDIFQYAKNMKKLEELLEPRENISIDSYMLGDFTKGKNGEPATFDMDGNKQIMIKMTRCDVIYSGENDPTKLHKLLSNAMMLAFSKHFAIETLTRWYQLEFTEIEGNPENKFLSVNFVVDNVLGFKAE